jgi:UPF0755 protein
VRLGENAQNFKTFSNLIKKVIIFILLTLPVLFIGFILYLYFFDFSKKRDIPPTIIEIERNERIHSVAKKLKQVGVINHEITFLIFGRSEFKKFKAGEFEIVGEVSLKDLFETFISGIFFKRKATIIPGWSMYEVAEELEKQKIIKSKEEFLMYAQDKDFLKKIGIEYDSVEGFLYPDTYFFTKNSDPRIVISYMVDNFFKKVGEKRLEEMKKKGFYKTLILASIVEEEATFNFEKPIIASVFLNRLAKNMPLQADPTAMYGLKIFTRPPRPSDLRIPNPYNTYTQIGLPPTPICSPTIYSIDAVLRPAKTKYLYFVAKGDGTHIFSETYEEHLKNIELVKTIKKAKAEDERKVIEGRSEEAQPGEENKLLGTEENRAQ